MAGETDDMVAALVQGQKIDSEYVDCFLLTYRQWMSPRTLIEKLEAEYMKPEKHALRIRYVNIVKKLLERHFFDFEEREDEVALESFLDYMERDGFQTLIGNLRKTWKFRSRMCKTESCNIDCMYQDPTIPEAFDAISAFDVTSVSSAILAQHLTQIDLELFKAVTGDCIARYFWGSREKDEIMLVPINRYISHFNRVGFWVATSILYHEEVKQRALVIGKFIKVAKACFDHHDFNTCMAVMSGLGTVAVSRLKQSWEHVASKRLSIYHHLEEYMSCMGNFRSYRSILSQAKLPIIPFFGLFIKDVSNNITQIAMQFIF